MDKEFIKHKKSKYIRDGIMSDIRIALTEKPRHTFLGSTDRKGYTVECRAVWMDREYSTLVGIEPFQDNKEASAILDKIAKESKYKIAEEIYAEFFSD